MEPLIAEKIVREQIFGVSSVTWWTWRRGGKLPPSLKIGRRYYYRREDIEKWIQERVELTKQLNKS